MANRRGKSRKDFIFLGSKSTADSECSHKNKRHLLLRGKAVTDLDSVLKIRDITLRTKVCIVNTSGFFSSYVWMWELNHKEGWVLKNWCFWIVVLEKALESPLDSKEIQPDNPKGNQPWISIGRTEAEVEALILWLPDVISQLIGKDPEAGKVWGQEKGETGCNGWIASLTQWMLDSDSMDFTLGDSEGQQSLLYCSPWGCKELSMT